MTKTISQKKNKKRGFTLIELIVVIAILGILAAILVPSMLGVVKNSRDAVNVANARSVYSAAQSAYVKLAMDNSTPAGDAKGIVYESTSTTDPFVAEIISDLGSGLTGTFSVTVGTDGVLSAKYNEIEYKPTAPTTAGATA